MLYPNELQIHREVDALENQNWIFLRDLVKVHQEIIQISFNS